MTQQVSGASANGLHQSMRWKMWYFFMNTRSPSTCMSNVSAKPAPAAWRPSELAGRAFFQARQLASVPMMLGIGSNTPLGVPACCNTLIMVAL